ncbi:MAG: RHS repeat-associated core domain-containing protein, partial [Lachnospiraceae bacterium]|nr:RHS repeat-associated core domain-containing protein [Lachnospiraceae bacterium]
MSAVSSDGTTITYTYDVDGTRSVKRVGDVSHTYIWEDGRPLQECVSGNTGIHSAGTIMYFYYDMNGRPYALQYNGTIYYYLLNAQGDVIRMIDSTGATVASYEYDPYGNIVSATGTMAEANPLRYRGYYYDSETDFYYLNSRYYDPKTGRFINADSYVSTGQGIMGYNMFAYC